MAASVPDQTRAAVGAPSSVRIGTVTSSDPVVISAQGVAFQSVGVMSSYKPEPGQPVVLLGQSPTSGSDPTSWLALGAVSQTGMQVKMAQQSGGSVNLPLAFIPLPGTQLDFTTTLPSTRVIAWYSADFQVVGSVISTAVVLPFLDGVGLPGQAQIILEMPVAAAAGRWTLEKHTTFTVGPGDHTIELRGYTASGSANQIQTISSTTDIMVMILG